MSGKISGQGWARGGLAFGAALSVLGNVAHTVLAKSDISLWLRVPFAVVWPVALFIGIEVLVRIDWRRAFVDHAGRVLLWGPTGSVAAVVSYLHLHDLMKLAGESWFAALVGPLAVDGLMIGCTVALLAIRAATLAPALKPMDLEVTAEDLEQIDTVVDRWTQNVTVPAEMLAEAPVQPMDVAQHKLIDGIENGLAPRKQRATPVEQEQAVRAILADHSDSDIVTETGVSLATIRTYRAAYRALRDNPMADIGPKFQGRTVRADLIDIIRDAANRERAL